MLSYNDQHIMHMCHLHEDPIIKLIPERLDIHICNKSDRAFKIYVQLLTGRCITIDAVTTHHIIEHICKIVERDTKIPIDRQRIIFAKRELSINETLGYYEIYDECILHLV